jgi:hypothetical protein
MSQIFIRFVTTKDFSSELIRLDGGVSMPFTPSHTEALTQDGKGYIGARFGSGITLQPVGYDADTLLTLPDGSKSERIVSLPCTPEQEAAFYKFVHGKIGEPYDWRAIIGFVDPAHEHELDHAICSAFMTQSLRDGCSYFRWPMTKPFHRISPDMLFLILSTHVEIPH